MMKQRMLQKSMDFKHLTFRIKREWAPHTSSEVMVNKITVKFKHLQKD